MSDAEFERQEHQYPPDFNPQDFTSPEKFLEMLNQPGVVSIGEEIRTSADQEAAEDKAKQLDMEVAYLHLLRWDDTLAKFPVFVVFSESVIKRPDGSSFSFRTPYEAPVTEEHVRRAEALVSQNEGIGLSEEERARLVIRHAMSLATGGQVYGIDQNGVELIHDPDEGDNETN